MRIATYDLVLLIMQIRKYTVELILIQVFMFMKIEFTTLHQPSRSLVLAEQ